MKSILILIALLAFAVTASADLKKIQGTWKPSEGHLGASAIPKAMLDKMVLTLKGNTYVYNEGHGDDIGTLKEIPGTVPAGLDILGTKGPNKGKTYYTIYKLEGATLTICYGLDGKRPKSFESKAKTMSMVITYHRSK